MRCSGVYGEFWLVFIAGEKEVHEIHTDCHGSTIHMDIRIDNLYMSIRIDDPYEPYGLAIRMNHTDCQSVWFIRI